MMALKIPPETVAGQLDRDDAASPGAEIWAQFAASLGGVRAELAAQREYQERMLRALHPIKVTLPPITTAAGSLNLPDLCGPRDGYAWDVRVITVNQAMTGGTVTMFSGGGGTQEMVFTATTGILQYGKGGLVLMPRDWLTFQAAGLTGSAQFCLRGVQVEVALIADYLN
jgi:hypothetical protein